jgi:hypothetical protein
MRRAPALLAAVACVSSLAAHAQSAAPLPDRDAFFAETRKRLASNDLLQSRYAYRQRVTDVRMNPFGEIGTGPIEVYDVYPVAGDDLTYRRLVERGGRPLSPAELAVQDREFIAHYQQWRRDLRREGKSERDARLRQEEIDRQRDRTRAEEAIDLFDFSLVGRDRLNGEPVIVVAFNPRNDARPRSREGRIARSFAGQAWVHEHEYEVIRVEAEALTDTTFGFGIIGRLHKGTKAVFVRRKIGDVWLPVETRVTGSGRAMLFRKVAIDYLRQYSDYRLFDPAELPALFGAATGSK